jgi:hypothetical protein
MKEQILLHLEKRTKGNDYSIEKATLIQHLEALLLEVLEPGMNKRGPDWKNAERFDQYASVEVTRSSLKKEITEIERKIDLL